MIRWFNFSKQKQAINCRFKVFTVVCDLPYQSGELLSIARIDCYKR